MQRPRLIIYIFFHYKTVVIDLVFDAQLQLLVLKRQWKYECMVCDWVNEEVTEQLEIKPTSYQISCWKSLVQSDLQGMFKFHESYSLLVLACRMCPYLFFRKKMLS